MKPTSTINVGSSSTVKSSSPNSSTSPSLTSPTKTIKGRWHTKTIQVVGIIIIAVAMTRSIGTMDIPLRHPSYHLQDFMDITVPTIPFDRPTMVVGLIDNDVSKDMTASDPNHNTQRPIIVEWERQDGVVIVTKIHGPTQMHLLRQMICLLTKAYNELMQYDIIIFTTIPFSKENITQIQTLGSPANITVVVDNPGLQTMIEQLEPLRKELFLARCNVTTWDEQIQLNWYSTCREGNRQHRLAYTWQAEFRAFHIWNHPALHPYRYMVWMDTDGFCAEVWHRDPVAFFIQHQLVILFDHFPKGSSRGNDFAQRYKAAFNTSLCGIHIEHGQLKPSLGRRCSRSQVPVKHIHGFFHITDLNFYRSPPVQHWTRTLIGQQFLSRKYDDQIAVTVPAAILAPNRSWDMAYHGIQLNVYHNGRLDGKYPVGGFIKYWNKHGKRNFTTAWKVCPIETRGR